MSWYAVDSVDDAIDATRSFLLPVEPGQWLRVALITIFVGVGGGSVSGIFNLFNASTTNPPEPTQQEPAPAPSELIPELASIDPTLLATLVVIGVLVILLGLAWRVVSETLRLVFYDALRTGTVRLGGPATHRFGQALRLFVFKLAIGVVFSLPLVAVGAAVLFTSVEAISGTLLLGGALLAAGVIAISFILSQIIIRVTNEFVAPVMVLTDSGVLDAWRRFWPVLRGNLSQFGVYVVVHFLLLLAISIGQSIIGAIIFGIVGITGALVALVVAVVAFGGLNAIAGSTVGLVTLGLIGLLTLLVVFALNLPISIVVLTYVFSYELSMLGAVDGELQLLEKPATDETDPSTPAV